MTRKSVKVRAKCPVSYCKEDCLLRISKEGAWYYFFCPFHKHRGFMPTTDKDADIMGCFQITEAQLLELKDGFKKEVAKLGETVTAKLEKEKVVVEAKSAKELSVEEIEKLLQEEIKNEKRTSGAGDGKGAGRDRTANRTRNGGDERLDSFYAGLRQEIRELDRKHEVA